MILKRPNRDSVHIRNATFDPNRPLDLLINWDTHKAAYIPATLAQSIILYADKIEIHFRQDVWTICI